MYSSMSASPVRLIFFECNQLAVKADWSCLRALVKLLKGQRATRDVALLRFGCYCETRPKSANSFENEIANEIINAHSHYFSYVRYLFLYVKLLVAPSRSPAFTIESPFVMSNHWCFLVRRNIDVSMRYRRVKLNELRINSYRAISKKTKLQITFIYYTIVVFEHYYKTE